MKSLWGRNSLLYLLFLIVMVALIFAFLPHGGPEEVTLGAFIDQAKQGQIDTIRQEDSTLVGLAGSEDKIKASFLGNTEDLRSFLTQEGVTTGEGGVKIDVKASTRDWGTLALQIILPLALFGFLFFFLFKSARGMGSQAFDFSKSRARLSHGDKSTVTFADVAGAEEAKEEVQKAEFETGLPATDVVRWPEEVEKILKF